MPAEGLPYHTSSQPLSSWQSVDEVSSARDIGNSSEWPPLGPPAGGRMQSSHRSQRTTFSDSIHPFHSNGPSELLEEDVSKYVSALAKPSDWKTGGKRMRSSSDGEMDEVVQREINDILKKVVPNVDGNNADNLYENNVYDLYDDDLSHLNVSTESFHLDILEKSKKLLVAYFSFTDEQLWELKECIQNNRRQVLIVIQALGYLIYHF